MIIFCLGQACIYKRLESFWIASTPGPKIFHYSEPSKQFYYSESRLLMDYFLEKLIGGMFLKKFKKRVELVLDTVALDVFFLSWLG